MRGKIIRSTGSWYDVVAEDGTVLKGRLRGKFRQGGGGTTNPITVGDNVSYEYDSETDDIVLINGIEPRQNYIIRKSVHRTGQGHLIASNIDIAVLVASLFMPRTSTGFIDRFLVSAESFRIPALVVFNKYDLLSEGHKEVLTELEDIYHGAGYETLAVSATENIGIEALREKIQGKTALFSGHSGVGKSSLLNTMSPGLTQKTGEVSTFANKGKHTTTFAEMFSLDIDTFIIDTPGIKEFGMQDVSPEVLGHYFPEMRALLNKCRYHNCLHDNEPACAVKDAVEQGSISETRYSSYISMLHGEDNRR
ncbi:MAG: ribosome small subunit-dependent GTPase A [Bacteroidota bacterium]